MRCGRLIIIRRISGAHHRIPQIRGIGGGSFQKLGGKIKVWTLMSGVRQTNAVLPFCHRCKLFCISARVARSGPIPYLWSHEWYIGAVVHTVSSNYATCTAARMRIIVAVLANNAQHSPIMHSGYNRDGADARITQYISKASNSQTKELSERR